MWFTFQRTHNPLLSVLTYNNYFYILRGVMNTVNHYSWGFIHDIKIYPMSISKVNKNLEVFHEFESRFKNIMYTIYALYTICYTHNVISKIIFTTYWVFTLLCLFMSCHLIHIPISQLLLLTLFGAIVDEIKFIFKVIKLIND